MILSKLLDNTRAREGSMVRDGVTRSQEPSAHLEMRPDRARDNTEG